MDTKTVLVGLVIGLLIGAVGGYALAGSSGSGLQSQVTALQAQVTNLTNDKTTLQSQLTAKTSEAASLQSQLTAKTAEAASLQTQLTTKTNEVTTLNSQITVKNTQITDLQNQITSLNNQITVLQSMVPPPPPSSGDPGSSRFFPASVGTTITVNYVRGSSNTYTAIITVKQVLRGAAAWTQIIAANQYNSPAPTGYEYILAKVSFNYVNGPTINTIEDVNAFMFEIFSSTGTQYDTPFSVVEPIPQFDSSLYPGATYEGWAVFQVSTTDTGPMMSFAVASDGSGGVWFKLY